jgi:hypothetical protein
MHAAKNCKQPLRVKLAKIVIGFGVYSITWIPLRIQFIYKGFLSFSVNKELRIQN